MKIIASQNRRKRWPVGFFLLFSPLFIWGFTTMRATDFTTNSAQTAPEQNNPDLRTRFYQTSRDDAAKTVQNLVPTLRTLGRTWKIAASSTRNDAIEIRCEVAVLLFTDDLTISLQSEKNGTRVDVRSQSRVGKADFGENRRHIAQLLRALDRQLTVKK